ncbi:MAG: ABC transporter permease [Chitinophagaceae bacterium]
MIKNYFILAYRNLKRNKTFSLINIGGLALGLAAFWLITLYVANEMSYDNYHTKANRIYRVAQHGSWPGGSFHLAVTPAPMALALQNDFPEIERTVRFDAEGGATLVYGEQRLQVGDIFFADSSVFKIFSYHFLYGDANTALSRPASIVLTQTLAKKLFGDASIALNKTISLGDNFSNLVTGVIEDVPANSHFSFSALRSMPGEGEVGKSWDNSSLYTYILLKDKAAVEHMNAAMPAFFNKYLKASVGEAEYRMELQPLQSIHLHSNLGYEMGTNGNFSYIAIFSLVAILILIIASINYMNLSTARSSLRVKEIGIRKVSGSGRGQLVLMFLAESVLITLIACFIAIGILNLLLPWFQHFVGKELAVWHFGTWQTILFLVSFSVLAGCLSGIYPALFLSGFKLIPSLKGQTGNHTGNLLFRQSLVVFQFVITIAMIAGSVVIWRQLDFAMKKDLGFNKEQVLTFHINQAMRNQLPAIKQQLLQNPLIEMVASASNPIGNNNIGGSNYEIESTGAAAKKSNKANIFQVDEDFIPAMQIKLISGRNFSPTLLTDKDRVVIVNETLVRDAGWKEAIGKRILLGKDSLNNPISYVIAGVVKDFNIYSLQHKIEPLILQLPPQAKDKDNVYVRISKKNIAAALSFIGALHKKYDPANPFQYNFLDQNFAKQYEAEKMQGTLLLIFAVLAISIACLGLFGLVTFTAEQRRKEIGVRKVLGSSVSGIVRLLAKDLLKLVMIAILIATPIAWFAMNTWLQGFAYRVNISWWIFALAGMLAILIAFVTVSFKAIKAGLANPVKSLRTE